MTSRVRNQHGVSTSGNYACAWCKHHQELSFALVSPSGAKVQVTDIRFTNRSAAGWVMLPLVATDEWSFKGPEARQIYTALKARETEIRALLK